MTTQYAEKQSVVTSVQKTQSRKRGSLKVPPDGHHNITDNVLVKFKSSTIYCANQMYAGRIYCAQEKKIQIVCKYRVTIKEIDTFNVM